MEHGDGQRTQELNNLKVALATFALRLDAFEARLKTQLTETSAEAGFTGHRVCKANDRGHEVSPLINRAAGVP
jgi:hypothetical protein